jgi:hypothetical protein
VIDIQIALDQLNIGIEIIIVLLVVMAIMQLHALLFGHRRRF